MQAHIEAGSHGSHKRRAPCTRTHLILLPLLPLLFHPALIIHHHAVRVVVQMA